MKIIIKSDTTEYIINENEKPRDYINTILTSVIEAEKNELKKGFIDDLNLLLDNLESGYLDQSGLIGQIKRIKRNLER